jgi:beta-lactamase regulating signal transducer with metallopeptidase domain
MNTAFIAVLLMSATGILLVLCLALLRPLTTKTLTSTWHYRMYILVVLFLLVPVGIVGGNLFSNIPSTTNQGLPNVPVILNDMITVQQTDIPPQTGQALPQIDLTAETLAAPVTTAFILKTVLSFLPLIWLVGVFVFIILYGIQFARFRRKIMRTSLQIDDTGTLLALENSMTEMGIKGKLRLLSNNIIKTPMLAGLFKTFLILPEVEMSERELKVILEHELTHFKRRDLWVKSLTLVANAIHWFNPVAYRLTKNIDTFCELSCDEQVVSDMNMEERQFYGETILNVLCRVINQHSGIYATLAESKKGIERRLTHMMNVKNISKRMIIFSFVIAATLCIMGFAMASFMNVTGEDTDLNGNVGEYSINGINEPKPDDTIRDSDVMQESTANPQDEKSPVSESNTPNDSYINGKYLWPVTGYDRISSAYGTRMHPVEKTMKFNNGIDIPAPSETPILAANTGTIIEMDENETDGYYVILDHGNGIQTFYSKLFGFAEGLAAGDTVQQGDVIGYVGATGEATGPHLHFSLTIDGEYIDPMGVLTQEN